MPNTDLLLARTYEEDRERGLDRRLEIGRALQDTPAGSSPGRLGTLVRAAQRCVDSLSQLRLAVRRPQADRPADADRLRAVRLDRVFDDGASAPVPREAPAVAATRLEQSQPGALRNRRGPGRDAQLVEDVRHVPVDRVRTDDLELGDRVGAQAARD